MTSRNMDELASQIGAHLLDRRSGVAVAESLTSGLLASALGHAPKASDWFRGAVVAYTAAAKQQVLSVAPGPVVTGACAREMAAGVAMLFHCDFAVATTGVGGPGSEEGFPPGTVFIGWWSEGEAGSEPHHFRGSPEEVVAATVEAALRRLLTNVASS